MIGFFAAAFMFAIFVCVTRTLVGKAKCREQAVREAYLLGEEEGLRAGSAVTEAIRNEALLSIKSARLIAEQSAAAAFSRGVEVGRSEHSAHAGLPDGLSVNDLIQLCHPDRHPVERQAVATRVTAKLLKLRS